MSSKERKRSRSEQSSSSSDSDSSSDHRSKKKSKKHKKEHKKKHHKKEHKKKDKKEHKKSHKKHKRDSRESRYADEEDPITSHISKEQDALELKEIEDFKRAVQSRKGSSSNSHLQSNTNTSEDISHLATQMTAASASSATSSAAAASSSAQEIFASSSDIASKYGISKGLIRTTESSLSITQKFSKTIFGGDDDNPATRQRMKREHAAQQAMQVTLLQPCINIIIIIFTVPWLLMKMN